MDKYWGKQTELTIKNFQIYQLEFPHIIIQTLSLIKWAAADINSKNNKINKLKSIAIKEAAWKIWQGNFKEQFPLSIWQSGSGTQTHMNVNEVIAGIANKNNTNNIHPNDDVNYGQSTNDTMVSAIHIAATITINEKLKPSIEQMINVFRKKSDKFGHIVKPGRTHYQDATLLTYKQEWSSYIGQLEKMIENINFNLKNLCVLPQGGTAVGNGINTYKTFDTQIVNLLSKTTKISFSVSDNKFRQMASHDDLLNISANLNTLATITNKIANDFRFLTSGPDCGINEIQFTANEAGSSIMAGKVNPTQCEMLSMASLHVMGSFHVISQANNHSHLQLNTYNPLIGYHLINSIEILASALNNFSNNFLVDISVNKELVASWTAKSKMLSTILVPVVGYDKVKEITNYAHKKQCSILEAVIKLNILDEATAKDFLQNEKMTKPED